jgi:phage-related protein
MGWTVETLAEVDSEIESLPTKLRARMLRLMEMVENVGLEHLREPHVVHVDGKIWELRAKAEEGIARGLYFTQPGRRVIVLRVFVKKTQKLPRRELEIARQRMERET